MKKIWKWMGIAIIALVFFGTFVFLYQKSQPKVKEYEICSTQTMDIERTTVVTGKIEPRDEVNIKPQISGIIDQLYKVAGQTVKKDEVIAKVKVIPDMSSLSSAENRVKLAQINLSHTQTDYERMQRLKAEQVVSDEEYEASEVKYRQAKEELANAKDALNITRKGISLSNAQMSTTLIRSTIDGIILDVPVKVGNSVILSNSFNDGTTIATVADMTNLFFKGNIDETEVGQLREGMSVDISIGAIPDAKLKATLEYISPKGVENNGANQFEIKAALSIPAGMKIRSGYSANAEIILERATKVLTIPESTLNFEEEKTYVYVLTDSTKGHQQFQKKEVTTGLSNGVNIQVKSGVKAGEKLRGIEIIKE